MVMWSVTPITTREFDFIMGEMYRLQQVNHTFVANTFSQRSTVTMYKDGLSSYTSFGEGDERQNRVAPSLKGVLLCPYDLHTDSLDRGAPQAEFCLGGSGGGLVTEDLTTSDELGAAVMLCNIIDVPTFIATCRVLLALTQ